MLPKLFATCYQKKHRTLTEPTYILTEVYFNSMADTNIVLADTLVGEKPKNWLLHGPTKRLIDNYHYHSPKVGVVASYTPKERDVKDHFSIFRGVDQIESFAQASIASCGTFSQCKKQNL